MCPVRENGDERCSVIHYTFAVDIRNFAHKGLRRLYDRGDGRGLPPGSVEKIRNMLAFLENMEDPSELHALPTWDAHVLTGGARKGTWSLSVTRNWRLTFWVDANDRVICDVNFEDYH
jgi:proteic killer suppression protein